MTIQVDLGRLRAARITWSKKPEFVKIEPQLLPELADQPTAANPNFPSQALGSGVALIIRLQSS